MEARESDISQGLTLGLSRAASALGKEYFAEQMPELRGKILEVLRPYPSEANERFVALYAEMAAISEASRLYYGEPALSTNELTTFLDEAVAFFNSFTHK